MRKRLDYLEMFGPSLPKVKVMTGPFKKDYKDVGDKMGHLDYMEMFNMKKSEVEKNDSFKEYFPPVLRDGEAFKMKFIDYLSLFTPSIPEDEFLLEEYMSIVGYFPPGVSGMGSKKKESYQSLIS